MSPSDDVWERRILCSDGNCIGIIGSDGCCKACGKPYTGELPLPSPADEPDDETSDAVAAVGASSDDTAAVDDDAAEPGNITDGGDTGDGWDARTLCADESCIGIIGPDGRCNECGKPYHETGDNHDLDADH